MTETRRPPQGSKPGAPSGISATEFQTLKAKVAELENQLTEALAEKNQWNSVLRRWQTEDRIILCELLDGKSVQGKIQWVDRYTLGIESSSNRHGPVIVHKGAVSTISIVT